MTIILHFLCFYEDSSREFPTRRLTSCLRCIEFHLGDAESWPFIPQFTKTVKSFRILIFRSFIIFPFFLLFFKWQWFCVASRLNDSVDSPWLHEDYRKWSSQWLDIPVFVQCAKALIQNPVPETYPISFFFLFLLLAIRRAHINAIGYSGQNISEIGDRIASPRNCYDDSLADEIPWSHSSSLPRPPGLVRTDQRSGGPEKPPLTWEATVIGAWKSPWTGNSPVWLGELLESPVFR